MKKLFVFLVCLTLSTFVFAQVNFSGNVYTGLRADISKSSNQIYAFEDTNSTPIWANFRIDYSLDKNAGATLNFRTKGTDVLSKNQATFYPFLNRGFVWVKGFDGLVKARSGFLWDLDFESNNNAWDTTSTYMWTTEVTAFPVKNVEIGFIVPTPYNKMALSDALKDITYGIVYSPDKFRFSAMGQYGSVDTNRSINFGIDYTGVKNLLTRVEGDLQQIGIDNLGYYQLFQQIAYTIGSVVVDTQVTEWLYKDGTANKFKVYPNITYTNGKVVYFLADNIMFTPDNKDNIYNQVKFSAQYNVNTKAYVKPGIYVTKDGLSDIVASPFIEFFAAF